MSKKTAFGLAFIAVCVVSAIFGLVNGLFHPFAQTHTRTFFAADTVCTLTVTGDEELLDGATDIVNELTAALNCKDDESELGRLNKTGVADSPSPHLLAVIERSLYFCRESNGAFDITVKPLTDIWDFKNQIIPPRDAVTSATQKIDYSCVKTDGGKIRLENNVQIDLGAVAKGYVAGQVAAYLMENKVDSAIINLGGNVTVIGNDKGDDFAVGIKDPFSENTAATVLCSNLSVATSGTYQRRFEKNGVNYHHLLDTKTGQPVQNGVASVTIISPIPTDADALSTLCFLLGEERGMAYINDLANTECIMIRDDGRQLLSDGLTKNSVGQIILKKPIGQVKN